VADTNRTVELGASIWWPVVALAGCGGRTGPLRSGESITCTFLLVYLFI
jgi:hypothetical protein